MWIYNWNFVQYAHQNCEVIIDMQEGLMGDLLLFIGVEGKMAQQMHKTASWYVISLLLEYGIILKSTLQKYSEIWYCLEHSCGSEMEKKDEKMLT